ncbi:MAG: hypothetical protein AAGI53_12345 [Planctomycetota bacterium]
MNATTRNRAIAGGGLLVCLAVSAALSGIIASSVGRNELGYAETATSSDPPEVAAGIAMGAFRGLFVNFLWIRANDLKQEGKFHESVELAKAITKLQPRFPRVWAFHAWNLAYNISVATQTPEERYNWVMAGINLLREEGIPANPNDLTLHRELAWIYLHKIGGYTDDSNQYYRRKVAQEWTSILGEPPRPSGDRVDVIQSYVDWLQPIVDAPETLDELIEADPAVAALVERIETEVDVSLDKDLLRLFTFHDKLQHSVMRDEFAKRFNDRAIAMDGMVVDETKAAAWASLLAQIRKRTLIDDFNMSPLLMIRYTKKFGPLDWRHPGAHSVYWSHRGVERALTRYTDLNEKNFDFTNADRITMQAIQSLWRSGDIYFNYIDFAAGLRGYFQGVPNPYFVQAYGDMAQEVEDRGGIFQSDQRVHRSYAAGYENFLTDAVIFFYRRGQLDRAEYWYREARTFENLNMNNQSIRIENFSKTLDDFVKANLYDRLSSPNVAIQEVYGSLQGAYASALQGETEIFRGQFEYAKQAHLFFMQTQYRQVVADGGIAGRMEFMDTDFQMVAGGALANMIAALPLEEAQALYYNTPVDVQPFGYDIAKARFEDNINVLAEAGESKEFGILFPEPPDMEQHRIDMAARERQRSVRELENINRQ